MKGGVLHKLRDKNSWLMVSLLKKEDRPSKEEIDELWLLRPAEKGVIKIMDASVETPRYSQTYSDEGKAYKFSGTSHTAIPIPPLLQRYLDYANRECEAMLNKDYGGRRFNMVFTNYYEDGSQHIGYHSDSESQLFKNAKGETLVYSISFGETRKFLVRSKEAKKSNKNSEKTLTIAMPDNTTLLMGGRMQANYKHKVPPTDKPIDKRLNLTFRVFK